ncbi:LapA family protein [Cytobacillus sp. FSL R7-0680]|uniref:LapA family protein n=1 Tax=Cytobacillus sp. FSL R7-0680 TaxID=2921689 RepID=UPI0030F51161
MKNQWIILLSIVFTLIVAIFAVINVDPVTVNYLFGESSWPLILVILSSVLMGGLIVSSVGLIKIFNLQREVKSLKKQLVALKGNEGQKEADKTHQVKSEFHDVKQLKVSNNKE